MKPTKKQETEVIKVYDIWLHSYLNGDIKTYDSYLDDEYRFIGSTDNEDFLNKTDTTKFLEATADQLAGKAEIRNSKRTIEKFDEFYFITDLFDAYFLNKNDWAYYGKFRFTSVLKEKKEGWRFIYQHFSTPDSKAQEGETLGTEQIAAENLQLREAVQRRTIELEHKSRELEIEAALDKVRAQMLEMKSSNELELTTFILTQHLKSLGVVPEGASVYIVIIDTNNHTANQWIVNDKSVIIPEGEINTPLNEHPLLIDTYKAWKNEEPFLVRDLEGEELVEFLKYFQSLPAFKDIEMKMEDVGERMIWSEATFSKGTLGLIHDTPLPQTTHNILIKFSKVFDLTYQRFLDLKKAEEQAREAQIEAALERVRSSSLAMHKSDELREVVKVVFAQLQELDFGLDGAAYIGTATEDPKVYNFWIGSDDKSYPSCFITPYHESPIIKDFWNALESGLDFFSRTYSKHEKNIWFEYAFENTDYKILPDENKKVILEHEFLTQSAAFAKKSMIGIHQYFGKELTENETDILKRFSRVFEQGYVRFLDLQKAEAQAREAQIEAALERVRSRSLAMKHSNELQEVISVLFVQMQNLGIKADASLINILTEDSKDFNMWIGTGGQTYAQKIKIPYIKHPVFDVFYEARDRGESFTANALTRTEKDSFFEYAFKYSDLKLMPAERKKYVMDSAGFARSFAWSKNSGITIQNYAGIPYSDQENNILKRFAQVFEQAYTRFLDVKNAEAQAQEAIKQASLDRVRAEIASMRTKDDLNRITPLIWKELNALQVPFIRCGVLIMDENREMIQTFLSTPAGQSLSAFEMSFKTKGIATGASNHWLKKEIYTDFWDKSQFVDFMQNLITEGKIENTKSFQGDFAPPEELYLNFVPFKQGMLYVGNTSPLAGNELDLIQSLAKTFAMAFARYEDFKELEAAKNKTDQTLSELKSTQTQLIQAEKMASLGELTAGIAHEIQNPLNFVNNFSELSKELLEEMKEELNNGEVDEAKEIAGDVIQNLEKINHHGKRADAIVKGMLQHSQTSSGQKELTDINALADEYLRLSYHGLRAKDKSFNAGFKLEADENLPKIEVVPQDIGRVLLNLINNAFYAVNEKVKQNVNDFKPMVVVSTKRVNNKVEIRVTDNGNGIPDSVKKKIFQPFFTTKPTGQGTGLGLSLSYDIIKAHGGELTVETKENEYTELKLIL